MWVCISAYLWVLLHVPVPPTPLRRRAEHCPSYLSESRRVLGDPGDPGDGDEDGRLVGHVLHAHEDGGRGGVDLPEVGRPVARQDLQVVARLPLVVEVL